LRAVSISVQFHMETPLGFYFIMLMITTANPMPFPYLVVARIQCPLLTATTVTVQSIFSKMVVFLNFDFTILLLCVVSFHPDADNE